MLPNGVSTEYRYDAASRLTAAIYRNALGSLGGLTYQYDAAGNRVRVGGSFARTLLPAPVASVTSDAANRLLTFGETVLAYDANGNLLSETDRGAITSFTWDTRNRLAALQGPTVTATLSYDALGRRSAKQLSGQTTQYTYDGLDISQELSNEGLLTYLRTLNIDEAVGRNGTEFYLADALMSTVALTNAVGAVETSYTYQPFGTPLVEGAVSANSIQFTGREVDSTGLHYHRARYYHPRLGRFISEDPITTAGDGDNQYAYAGGNPLLYRDPHGLTAVPTAAGALIGGVLLPGPGAVIGAVVGTAVGVAIGYAILKQVDLGPPILANAARPPAGSKPIDQTPWSGDHKKIKDGVGADPDTNVKIDPDGNVWAENPDGTWENHGPAKVYTGSGRPSGRKGKDRERGRGERY
jgi:RHS repeat-associated protein